MEFSAMLILLFNFLLLFLSLNVASSSLHSSFSSSSSSSSSSSVLQLCSHEEAAALLQFKSSFYINLNLDSIHCNDPEIESWKEGVDCCSWDGIRCDNLTGRVIELALGCSQLSGPFSSNNSLFLLKNLESLKLYGNDFQGSKIPYDIGRFSSLNGLALEKNNLSGSIPTSIGNLSLLTGLNLAENNLNGLIPSSLLNLTQLYSLDLSFNQFSGPIPGHSHASGFPSLRYLFMRFNLLNGTIPPWIFSGLPQLWSVDLSHNQLQGQLSQFQQESMGALDLSHNRFHGSIPSSIHKFVDLTLLDLSSNNLSGIVEFDMFSGLQNLEFLDLSNNNPFLHDGINTNFTLLNLTHLLLPRCGLSRFPSFIRKSTRIVYLDLSDNMIEGPIPEWMWVTGKDTLVYLNMSRNLLTGGLEKIPWKNIEFLDLQSNKFQGTLPIPPNETIIFTVSKNNLSGEISSEICKIDSFEVLDLSHNNFGGNIPNCLFNLSKNLRALSLQGNEFHGTLPSVFLEGCGLQSLNLNGNQVEGALPRSLVNCAMLEVLDVGNNNIKDTFPNWLESLAELQVLVLRWNKFHGSINSDTKKNSSFPKLRILDLSNNDFVGPLPVRYIGNWNAMVDPRGNGYENSSLYMEYQGRLAIQNGYHFSMEVTLKGKSMEMEKILITFTSIDLSKNKFVGEIPAAIGRLHSLKGLNLSHNNLGGYIPPSLGKLANMEALDLSSNELVGKIPEELASLTQLAILNLSNNQLFGHIPEGKQFETFEIGSYRGNLGLCGPPVSKTCGGNGSTEQPPTSFQEKDEFWVFITWRVVGLGFGCGTIFGLLTGYLIFHTGKPKWFVSTFDLYPYLREMKMKRARRRIQRKN